MLETRVKAVVVPGTGHFQHGGSERGVARARRGESRWNAIGRGLAAALGSIPLSLLLAACLSRVAPFEPGLRFAIAYGSAIPIWLLLSSRIFLMRTAMNAWAFCLGASLLFALALHVLPS